MTGGAHVRGARAGGRDPGAGGGGNAPRSPRPGPPRPAPSPRSARWVRVRGLAVPFPGAGIRAGRGRFRALLVGSRPPAPAVPALLGRWAAPVASVRRVRWGGGVQAGSSSPEANPGRGEDGHSPLFAFSAPQPLARLSLRPWEAVCEHLRLAGAQNRCPWVLPLAPVQAPGFLPCFLSPCCLWHLSFGPLEDA